MKNKYIMCKSEFVSEKKVNKKKSGKYIYKDYIKIWNDLNNRSIVAQDKNRNKKKKIRMECKSEGESVRKKWISKKVEKKVINIMKEKKKRFGWEVNRCRK